MRTKILFNSKVAILGIALSLMSIQAHAAGLLIAAPDLGYVGKKGTRMLAFKEDRQIIFRVCADNAYLGESVKEARKNCKNKTGKDGKKIEDICVDEKILARELPKILTKILGINDKNFEKQVQDILLGKGGVIPEFEKLKEKEDQLAAFMKSKKAYGDDSVTPGLEETLRSEIDQLKKTYSNLSSEVENLQKIMDSITNGDALTVDVATAREEERTGHSVSLPDVLAHFRDNESARYGIDVATWAVLKQVEFSSIINDSKKKKHPVKENGKTVEIMGVEFEIGSPKSEEGRMWYGTSDEDQWTVYFTKNVDIAKTETTQKFWREALELAEEKAKNNSELARILAKLKAQMEREIGNRTISDYKDPSRFKGSDLPVETVSYSDSKLFIDILNVLTKGSDFKYRLPTEAQWEYAARAGTTTPYSFKKDEIDQYAVYGKAGKQAAIVKGNRKPNAFGLYDMHGNVWEWTEDLKAGYSELSFVIDPVQEYPKAGSSRVMRGGSWGCSAQDLRSANRGSSHPGYGFSNVGFRLARMPRNT